MPLERIYVIPHGDEILDLPNRESEEMAESIRNMVKGDNSETIAIISPHGLSLPEKVSIITSERIRGYFKLQTRAIRKTYFTDKESADQLCRDTEKFTEKVKFVTSKGPKSVFPADFGTLIPLEFFPKKKLIYMGEPRPRNINDLVEFGKTLYDFVNKSDRRISIIISADQAHAHSAAGPYAYSDKAAVYDKMLVEAVKSSDFEELLKLDPEFIADAKPDSFWNMAILSGLLKRSGLKLKFQYYYMQIYFGMLSAYASPE